MMTTLIEKAQALAGQDFDKIPVISLADATSPDPAARRRLASTIQHACLTAGFFYIQDHGVPRHVIDNCFSASRQFFTSPGTDAAKRGCDMYAPDAGEAAAAFRGWMGLLTENTNPENVGDLHEAFNLGMDVEIAREFEAFQAAERDGKLGEYVKPNRWPRSEDWQGADEFKAAVLEYYRSIVHLGKSKLFPLLALALELPEDFFEDKTRYPAAIQRLLYYPPLNGSPSDRSKPGIGEHTDYEVFTVLCQDEVGGLEVRNLSGEWISSPPIPGTFLINIGDQLSRWSNDLFRSTLHRALPPPQTTPRFSIPVFWGCDEHVVVECLPSCVAPGEKGRYAPVKAGEYVRGRLEETYGTAAADTKAPEGVAAVEA